MHLKMIRAMLYALSHIGIGSGMTLLTFYVVDRFNTAMAFVDHPMSKKLLLAFSIALIVISAVEIADIVFSGRKLWLCIIPTFALTAAGCAICLVTLDALEPERILFTKNAVKTVFGADAVTGVASCICYVAMRRSKNWRRNYGRK